MFRMHFITLPNYLPKIGCFSSALSNSQIGQAGSPQHQDPGLGRSTPLVQTATEGTLVVTQLTLTLASSRGRQECSPSSPSARTAQTNDRPIYCCTKERRNPGAVLRVEVRSSHGCWRLRCAVSTPDTAKDSRPGRRAQTLLAHKKEMGEKSPGRAAQASR